MRMKIETRNEEESFFYFWKPPQTTCEYCESQHLHSPGAGADRNTALP